MNDDDLSRYVNHDVEALAISLSWQFQETGRIDSRRWGGVWVDEDFGEVFFIEVTSPDRARTTQTHQEVRRHG